MRSRVVVTYLLAAAAAALVVIGCALSGGAAPGAVLGSRLPPSPGPGSARSSAVSTRQRSATAVPRRPSALTAIEGGCVLFTDAAATATSQDCLRCHADGGGTAKQLSRCHAIEIPYPSAPSHMLRPVAEVIRRGIFLPDNTVRCVTCHDGASPWAAALALPPGSPAIPAVNPRDPRTYAPSQAAVTPQPGDRVSPKPLCLGCHAAD